MPALHSVCQDHYRNCVKYAQQESIVENLSRLKIYISIKKSFLKLFKRKKHVLNDVQTIIYYIKPNPHLGDKPLGPPSKQNKIPKN